MIFLFTSLYLMIFMLCLIKYSHYLVPILIVSSVCLYTLISCYIFNFGRLMPFSLFRPIDDEFVLKMFTTILLLIFTYGLGIIVTLLIMGRGKKISVQKMYLPTLRVQNLNIYLFILVFWAMIFMAYGSDFLSRDGYFIATGNSLIRRLILPLVIISCFIMITNTSLIAKFTFVIFTDILLLAISSRICLLFISICLIISFFMSRSGYKKSFIVFFSSILIVDLLYLMPLRYADQQGLFWIIDNISSTKVNLDLIIFLINYLTSFSFFATVETLSQTDVSNLYIGKSINPLPGSYIDLSEMIVRQKFNEYSPFSAIGTLSYNTVTACLIFMVFSICTNTLLFLSSNRSSFLTIFISIFLMCLCLQAFQYNLRGTIRLYYYLIFIVLTIRFILALRKRKMPN